MCFAGSSIRFVSLNDNNIDDDDDDVEGDYGDDNNNNINDNVVVLHWKRVFGSTNMSR